MRIQQLPIREVVADADRWPDGWPFTLAPVAQLLRTFDHDPALLPYYEAMKVWSLLGGTSELWLRLPSILAM